MDAQIIIPRLLFTLSSASIFGGPRQLTNVTFVSYSTPEIFPDRSFAGLKSVTNRSSINSAIIGIHVQGKLALRYSSKIGPSMLSFGLVFKACYMFQQVFCVCTSRLYTFEYVFIALTMLHENSNTS